MEKIAKHARILQQQESLSRNSFSNNSDNYGSADSYNAASILQWGVLSFSYDVLYEERDLEPFKMFVDFPPSSSDPGRLNNNIEGDPNHLSSLTFCVLMASVKKQDGDYFGDPYFFDKYREDL